MTTLELPVKRRSPCKERRTQLRWNLAEDVTKEVQGVDEESKEPQEGCANEASESTEKEPVPDNTDKEEEKESGQVGVKGHKNKESPEDSCEDSSGEGVWCCVIFGCPRLVWLRSHVCVPAVSPTQGFLK